MAEPPVTPPEVEPPESWSPNSFKGGTHKTSLQVVGAQRRTPDDDSPFSPAGTKSTPVLAYQTAAIRIFSLWFLNGHNLAVQDRGTWTVGHSRSGLWNIFGPSQVQGTFKDRQSGPVSIEGTIRAVGERVWFQEYLAAGRPRIIPPHFHQTRNAGPLRSLFLPRLV
ncbi:hypothetical protein RUND412_005095, partial [Rhizina undulata]